MAEDSVPAGRLGQPGVVWGWFFGMVLVFLAGIVLSPHPYADPRFVVGFVTTELIVTALLVASLALFPAAAVGLRAPVVARGRWLAPAVILSAVAFAAWVAARRALPPDAGFDTQASWLVLRTTALVGVNEEWIFRGVLLAAFARWWGLRRGAFAALFMFGSFHLLNMAAGVPPVLAVVQLCSTFLLGSTFLLVALGSRSLVPAMILHGFYDFAVVDINRMIAAGAPGEFSLGVMVCGALCGVWSLVEMARLKPADPFAGR